MASQELAVENRDLSVSKGASGLLCRRWLLLSLVFIFAAAIYLRCVLSPPSLIDDVDDVHAQIARTMLASGDWVTACLDAVLYLDQAPFIYFLMAIFYKP